MFICSAPRCRFSTVVAALGPATYLCISDSSVHLPHHFLQGPRRSRTDTHHAWWPHRPTVRISYPHRTARGNPLRGFPRLHTTAPGRDRPYGRSRPSIHLVRGRDWASPGPARPTRRGPEPGTTMAGVGSSAMSNTQAIYRRDSAGPGVRHAGRPRRSLPGAPRAATPCPPVHPEPTSPPSPIPQAPHG